MKLSKRQKINKFFINTQVFLITYKCARQFLIKQKSLSNISKFFPDKRFLKNLNKSSYKKNNNLEFQRFLIGT